MAMRAFRKAAARAAADEAVVDGVDIGPRHDRVAGSTIGGGDGHGLVWRPAALYEELACRCG
jgi:hypothetical protein